MKGERKEPAAGSQYRTVEGKITTVTPGRCTIRPLPLEWVTRNTLACTTMQRMPSANDGRAFRPTPHATDTVLPLGGDPLDARLPLALEPGRYRLTATVRTRGIAGGSGFRLRLGGEGDRKELPALSGDRDWQEAALDFTVAGGDPALVLELRAEAGEAWVDREKLRLTRLP